MLVLDLQDSGHLFCGQQESLRLLALYMNTKV